MASSVIAGRVAHDLARLPDHRHDLVDHRRVRVARPPRRTGARPRRSSAGRRRCRACACSRSGGRSSAGVTPARSAMVSDAVPSKPPSAKQSTAASRMRSFVSSLLVLRGRPGLRLAGGGDGNRAVSHREDGGAGRPRSAAYSADRLVDGVDRGVHEPVVGADDPVVRRLRSARAGPGSAASRTGRTARRTAASPPSRRCRRRTSGSSRSRPTGRPAAGSGPPPSPACRSRPSRTRSSP